MLLNSASVAGGGNGPCHCDETMSLLLADALLDFIDCDTEITAYFLPVALQGLKIRLFFCI
jgi:hypothetical protein